VDTMERRAVVTGAGRGIGRAVALGLSREDFRVFAVGRRLAALQETADLAAAWEGRIDPFKSDISDSDDVTELFAQVQQQTGRLDLLFNNAGEFGPVASIEEIGIPEWQATLAVNLTGTFLCTREAFRMMRNQTPRGGRIINNGSLSAHSPRPRSAAYTTTKHGLTGLTKSTALDGRPYDIACGQIDIGNAETEMTHSFAKGSLQPSGLIVPEPRVDLHSVVRAVVYMASLPLAANVLFMTVMATKMPFVGRG